MSRDPPDKDGLPQEIVSTASSFIDNSGVNRRLRGMDDSIAPAAVDRRLQEDEKVDRDMASKTELLHSCFTRKKWMVSVGGGERGG